MIYSKGSHTTFCHRFHVVWSTKYRYRVLHGAMRERIRETIFQTCTEMGVHIVKGVLAQDHVHMLLPVPLHIALSKVMHVSKAGLRVASRWNSQNCANATGVDGFGPVDISLPPQEMSLTISCFSIWNCIPNRRLPVSAGSRSPEPAHQLHS